MHCLKTAKHLSSIALLLLLLSSLSFAREIHHATQTKVLVVDHPSRIVTLAPSLGS